MTVSEYRDALVNTDDAADLVRRVYNCQEVSIDPDGSIWIAEPQAGHYLSDDEVLPLMAAEQISVIR